MKLEDEKEVSSFNCCRCIRDTTVMGGNTIPPWDSEEIEYVDLKLNIQKTKSMASGPITSWQIDGGVGNSGNSG